MRMPEEEVPDTGVWTVTCSALTANVKRPAMLKVGSLLLHLDSNQVAVEGTPVALTVREYELLRFMVTNRGKVLTKPSILMHLYEVTNHPDIQIIDVHICKLRRKLAKAGAKDLIGTVWGKGYTIRDPSGDGVHNAIENCAEAMRIFNAAA